MSFKEGFTEDNRMGITFKREVKPDQKIYNPFSPSDLGINLQPLLRNLSWVKYYVKSEKLKKEHAVIEAEREKIVSLPPALAEILEEAKREYQARQALRQRKIASLLSGQTINGPSIFDDQAAMDELRKSLLPPWEEIESAIASLPEGISSDERRRKIAKLDAKHDYGKCHPESRYLISTRQVEVGLPPGCHSGTHYQQETVKADFWGGFVQAWRKIQGSRCAPCDILGFDLEDADPEVKEAWQVLGLGQYVNEDSPNLPARGNARVRFRQFFAD